MSAEDWDEKRGETLNIALCIVCRNRRTNQKDRICDYCYEQWRLRQKEEDEA